MAVVVPAVADDVAEAVADAVIDVIAPSVGLVTMNPLSKPNVIHSNSCSQAEDTSGFHASISVKVGWTVEIKLLAMYWSISRRIPYLPSYTSIYHVNSIVTLANKTVNTISS